MNPHGKKPRCVQVTWELSQDNQDREIAGLLEAMEFFHLDAGTIITRDSRDVILDAGRTIAVTPAWEIEFERFAL